MKIHISDYGQLFHPIRASVVNAGIRAISDDLDPGFPEWARRNFHIIDHVIMEVAKVKAAGFNHYSMRTIIEVTRHHTALRQSGGAEYKINDHITPDLSRLVTEIFYGLDGFFSMRKRTSLA